MVTNDHNAAGGWLVARMDERFFAPFKRNVFATRTWFFVTVAVILAVHGAVIGYLLYRDATTPIQTAKAEETPVEVIVEKPPDPPKPPPEKKPQKPETKQTVEKPATSAPRAPNEEKIDTQQTQKETRAPKAPTPPKDGQPDKVQQASSPSTEPAPPDKSEEDAAQKEATDKDAEALDKAVPEPPKKPPSLMAKPKPPAKVQSAKSAVDRLADSSTLADFTFARPTKRSPVYGGTEDSRYLAIVYGMIMANRHPVQSASAGGGDVTIAFDVDDRGNVTGADFVHRSGYPEIDGEALAAIRRAAPFPPPPPGAPHGLIATIDFRQATPGLTTDPRAR